MLCSGWFVVYLTILNAIHTMWRYKDYIASFSKVRVALNRDVDTDLISLSRK